MKNFKNDVNVTGYVFNLGKNFNELQKNVTGPNSKHPGTEYIRGEINVATDDDAMNVVAVRFDYVPKTKKDGSENNNYKILSDLMEHCDTYETHGKEATKVRILGSIDCNDWTNRDGEQVTSKRIRGGFISTDVRNNPVLGATFDADMLIAACTEREYNDKPYVEVRGYVFNFFREAIPVTFNIRSGAGMDYFMGLDASSSNPTLTEVKGDIISSTVERQIEEESAFGAPTVRTVTRSLRTWDINWANPEPYEWDDESTLTKKEFKAMLQAREEKLAADQKRQEERRASREGKAGFPEKSTKKTAPVVEEEDDDEFPF